MRKVLSIIRTIFTRPDAAHVSAKFDGVAHMLARIHPKVAAMLMTPAPARRGLVTGTSPHGHRAILGRDQLDRAHTRSRL